MKKTIPFIAAVALSSVSTLSLAEGAYVFGSIGQSDIDTGISSASGFTVDESDTMFNLGVGIKLNDHFSIEAGYTDLGEASIGTASPVTGSAYGSTVTLDGTLSADVNGYFVGVKGEMDVAEKVSLFAKAGLLTWESEATFSGTVTVDGTTYTGSVTDELSDGTDPYVSLGAAYAVNEAVSFDFQVSRYMLDFEGSDVDVDTLSIGATFNF